MKMTYDEAIKSLTMALMYLTRWSDPDYAGMMKPGDVLPDMFSYEEVISNYAWKGYDFDVLNALTEEDLIRGSKRSKSVWLTPDGVAFAVNALKELGLEIVFSEDQEKNRVPFGEIGDYFLNVDKIHSVSDDALKQFLQIVKPQNNRDRFIIENVKAELYRRKQSF